MLWMWIQNVTNLSPIWKRWGMQPDWRCMWRLLPWTQTSKYQKQLLQIDCVVSYHIPTKHRYLLLSNLLHFMCLSNASTDDGNKLEIKSFVESTTWKPWCHNAMTWFAKELQEICLTVQKIPVDQKLRRWSHICLCREQLAIISNSVTVKVCTHKIVWANDT